MSKNTLMTIVVGAAGIFLGQVFYAEYVKYRSTPAA